MDFSKINKVGRMESSFIPTKKLSELEKEIQLCITAVRQVTTQFGPRITVDVDNTFSVFLPTRIAKLLTAADNEDALKTMVCASAEKRLYMRYLGGAYNNIEFVYI